MSAVNPIVMEALGWAATAVFVGSYFMRADVLVRVQMLGAVMWVAYGLLMRAPPVVVANVLVFGAAAWKAWQGSRSTASPASTNIAQRES
jgi:hypothetical protein